MTWERVYTINHFHDCPRLGVADFGGQPHIYQSWFDKVRDDWSGVYYLSEIGPDLLTLVMEDWSIWRRWKAAFDAGTTGIETHPALPPDQRRHVELSAQIGERLTAPSQSLTRAKAEFRALDLEKDRTEVKWKLLS